MSREPRGAEERGRTVLAGEDLLLVRLALRALLSVRVENVRPAASSDQQLVPHRVPQPVLVSDLHRREARAAQVAQEHLAVRRRRGGARRHLVRGQVFLQVRQAAELLPAVAAVVRLLLR